MIEAAHRDGPDNRIELGIVERREQLVGIGAAGLVDGIAHHVADDVAQQRAQPRRVVELRLVGVEGRLVPGIRDLIQRIAR